MVKDFVLSLPKIDNSLCIKYLTPKSECKDCKDICPTNAIELKTHPIILPEKCIECCICYSACKFSAISIRKDDEYILENIRNYNKISIGCIFSKAEIKISCISRITESLLLTLIIKDKEIEILKGNCKNCKFNKTMQLFKYNIKKTMVISKSINIKPKIKIKKRVSEKPFLPDTSIRRRDFIKIKPKKKPTEKRMLILNKLKEKKISILKENTYPETANLEISQDCTLCGICEHICPTKAIYVKKESTGKLIFYPPLCTGCKECQNVCAYKAITITNGTTSNLTSKSKILIEIKEKTCQICGKTFYSNKNTICPTCQSKERKKKDLIEFLKDI